MTRFASFLPTKPARRDRARPTSVLPDGVPVYGQTRQVATAAASRHFGHPRPCALASRDRRRLSALLEDDQDGAPGRTDRDRTIAGPARDPADIARLEFGLADLLRAGD